MKKSKLSITLVTSFIAAMAMSACSSVKSDKEAIVKFVPYGKEESVALLTDDVYGAYAQTSAGVSKFYDKILELLIRYKFKQGQFEEGELKYKEIEDWAKNQVQEQKNKAKADAKANGTSYDHEWEHILENNNVDNATELREKFIYEKEKEVMEDWYATNDANAEALKNEFIGIDGDGKKIASNVKAAMPYHIRHILVKVDEAGDAQEKFYKGTVTEAQAQLLYDTVTTLASGDYTFAQVASMYSEDGSASSGGDVGIMTNAASSGSLGMVNEFQLGLYAYDNLYDQAHTGDGTDAHPADAAANDIKDALGFNSVVGTKDDGSDIKAYEALSQNITEIPYQAFLNMGKYAKVTADGYGNKLANGSTTVYPRNIIWNKYMNLHNVFLIKNANDGDAHFGDADKTVVKSEFLDANLAKGENVDNTNGDYRFNAQGYLVDENDNVIIGVRSQHGLHFMVIEKSMYEYKETKDAQGNVISSSLADYYSTKIPGEDGYTSDSYVGYIESQSKEDFKKRADDVKSKITSFDSTYDYRLYQWLTDEMQVQFTGSAEKLGDQIESYINTQRADNSSKQEEGLQKVWKTYTRMLGVQEYNRTVEPWTVKNPVDGTQSPFLTRLVSEQIAEDFYKLYDKPDTYSALYEKFAEGGDYYYYA